MKRFWFLFVAVLVIVSVSGGVFGAEGVAEQKMIRGKITSVDCDKGTIALSEVQDLRSKKKIPDVMLKLTKETKLTYVEECKEIQQQSVVIGSYVERDDGNVAMELILPKKFEEIKRHGNMEKEELKKIGDEVKARAEKAKAKSKEGSNLEKEQNGSDK
jgi:hypothetical protein